jgi:threonine synthase
VTLAGLKKLVTQGFVKPNESVVLVLTGHVLKDSEYTLKFHRGDLFTDSQFQKDADVLKPQQRAPITLEPSVEAVIELLQSAEK